MADSERDDRNHEGWLPDPKATLKTSGSSPRSGHKDAREAPY